MVTGSIVVTRIDLLKKQVIELKIFVKGTEIGMVKENTAGHKIYTPRDRVSTVDKPCLFTQNLCSKLGVWLIYMNMYKKKLTVFYGV